MKKEGLVKSVSKELEKFILMKTLTSKNLQKAMHDFVKMNGRSPNHLQVELSLWPKAVKLIKAKKDYIWMEDFRSFRWTEYFSKIYYGLRITIKDNEGWHLTYD